jgi:hypothetical protein
MMDSLPPPPFDEPRRRRAIALAVWTAMGLVAAVVASRGMSGAMVRSLPMEWLLLWIVGGHVVSAWAGRMLPAPSPSPQGAIIGCVAALLCSFSLAAVLTPFQWGVALGVAVLHGCYVCEPWLWSRELRVESRESEEEQAPQSDLALNSQLSTLNSQWMQRRDDDDGEICEGHVRVDFAEGAREATVHVAFCPPLPSVPTVELEDIDGLGWELKTAAAYPYGLRITVRRGPRETAAAAGHVAYWACAPQGTIKAA